MSRRLHTAAVWLACSIVQSMLAVTSGCPIAARVLLGLVSVSSASLGTFIATQAAAQQSEETNE